VHVPGDFIVTVRPKTVQTAVVLLNAVIAPVPLPPVIWIEVVASGEAWYEISVTEGVSTRGSCVAFAIVTTASVVADR
jgi:hypothetical protein